MANNLNIAASINGTVNTLVVGSSGNSALTPAGALVIGESVAVNTGAFQLITTGSASPISIIYIGNTSNSSSINVAISASGVVSSLGSIAAVTGSATQTPSIINWNNTFSGLYAQAVTTQSYGVFVVSSQ